MTKYLRLASPITLFFALIFSSCTKQSLPHINNSPIETQLIYSETSTMEPSELTGEVSTNTPSPDPTAEPELVFIDGKFHYVMPKGIEEVLETMEGLDVKPLTAGGTVNVEYLANKQRAIVTAGDLVLTFKAGNIAYLPVPNEITDPETGEKLTYAGHFSSDGYASYVNRIGEKRESVLRLIPAVEDQDYVMVLDQSVEPNILKIAVLEKSGELIFEIPALNDELYMPNRVSINHGEVLYYLNGSRLTYDFDSGQWIEPVLEEIEQPMTVEQIQHNVAAFLDMPENEFREKVEKLHYFYPLQDHARDFDGTRIGGGIFRLGYTGAGYFGSGSGIEDGECFELQGVLLGAEIVRNADNNYQYIVLIVGIEDPMGGRKILHSVMGPPDIINSYNYHPGSNRQIYKAIFPPEDSAENIYNNFILPRIGDVVYFEVWSFYEAPNSLSPKIQVLQKALEVNGILGHALLDMAKGNISTIPFLDAMTQEPILPFQVSTEVLGNMALFFSYYFVEDIQSFLE